MEKCVNCGARNPKFVHRPTGNLFCSDCWNHMHRCIKCKKVSLEGITLNKERYCWDCYLKEWGIQRRRPKTRKDFRLLEKLSKPIWEQ